MRKRVPPAGHFHANQSHFHNNGFALKTRFETEAQENSEMAYFRYGTQFFRGCGVRFALVATLWGLWRELKYIHIIISSILAGKVTGQYTGHWNYDDLVLSTGLIM